MHILIPLISFLGLTSVFANIFKTRFTFSLPIVTSLLVGFLWLSTVLGILYYATGFIIVIGIISQIYSLYSFPHLRESIILYRIELIGLLIIIISYCIFTQNAYIRHWDEATWATFIKELKMHHTIYPPSCTLTSIGPAYIHYPRGTSLFYYFTLYFSDYDEINVRRSHFILELIFLSPIMANRHFWQTICLVSFILLGSMNNMYGLYTIYNDNIIALVFSSILMIFFLEENKYKALFLITPILLFMPLFKEVGVWLGVTAAIIIFNDFIVNNDPKFKTYSTKLCLLLGLLILPLITNYLWFKYAESHIILGRKTHNLASLWELMLDIFNRNGQKRAALFYSLNIICNALFIAFMPIYAILMSTWIMIDKYAEQYKKSFIRFLIVSLCCFILFIIWRLYLYLVVLEAIANTTADHIVRYIFSFALIFVTVSCVYIKKILFDQGLWSLDKGVSVGLYILTIISFSTLLMTLLNRIPRLQQDPPHLLVIQNTQLIHDLYSKGFKIDYDFRGEDDYLRKGDGMRRRYLCYTIAYYLSPYYNAETRAKCNDENKNPTTNIELNKVNSNIDIHNILENSTQYKDKCSIKYYPVQNHVDIECPYVFTDKFSFVW